jgi:23S rRNA pseudouridine1911/1915/1917 synthase
MSDEHLIYIVTSEKEGERIDKYLSRQLPDKSRSALQKLVKEEKVFVNDSVIKSNYKIAGGDRISIILSKPVEEEILPEEIPLDIIYEDNELLIVNKPKGMVVHPSPGHYHNTLVNALLYHCKEQLSDFNGELRPGIVHRIDMDTTGALIVCKNNEAHMHIANQLKEHTITRKYRAIVCQNIKEDEGTIEKPIGRHPIDRKKMSVHAKISKNAVTHYRVLERFGAYTYIECQLETGRTHQIRVHMASIQHSVLGDTVYGMQKQPIKLQGQTLHAMVIGFIHPITNEYMEFSAPLPDYFERLLTKFRNL